MASKFPLSTTAIFSGCSAPNQRAAKNVARPQRSYATPELCQLCAHGTGEPPYMIEQLIKEMVQHCREMKLYVDAPKRQLMLDVAVLITVLTVNYLHKAHHKVPI